MKCSQKAVHYCAKIIKTALLQTAGFPDEAMVEDWSDSGEYMLKKR